MPEFVGAGLPLSQSGLDETLGFLGVGAAEMWTVLSVETHGCGFLEDRRPAILFERHIFHKETGGKYSATNPDISSPKAGGYLSGAREYDRLAAAMALDRHAALDSASWGIGQVMGFNSKAAGFDSVEAMVDAMLEGEDVQLKGMANFLKAKKLDAPLASHDWAKFAKGYNGADYAKNQYDTKLAAFYQKYSAGLLPDLRVRAAQLLLNYLGFHLGDVDGIIGKRTRSAAAQFREQNGLGSSDRIDDALIAALQAKVQAAGALGAAG